MATRDFYRIGNRKLYLYDRLENGDSKERVEVAEGLVDGTFSVEHVMPQTPSDAWKASLGPDWERVHATWLHRMANLTVTAYNSDYSNRPFEQKRDMRDGLRASGFRLNQWIASQDEWGEEQLEERSERLVRQFLATWPMPASSYVPQSAIPDEAALDSDVEFTGRRLTAFSFMGARYPAKQWNTMVGMVMGLVAELEPSEVYSLVAGTTYPASLFRATRSRATPSSTRASTSRPRQAPSRRSTCSGGSSTSAASTRATWFSRWFQKARNRGRRWQGKRQGRGRRGASTGCRGSTCGALPMPTGACGPIDGARTRFTARISRTFACNTTSTRCGTSDPKGRAPANPTCPT